MSGSTPQRGARGPAVTDGRPEVSVVIVHYETPDLLDACLRSLAVSDEAERLEVFVIDNASRRFNPDAVSAAFPGAKVIRNADNRGFAVASNQGLHRAHGRYLLLLNPDTRVERSTIPAMRDYLDAHTDVGCATCRVELPDGSLDLACRRLFPTPERSLYRMTLLSRVFPRSKRFGAYNLTYVDEWQETEIDTPCGAFMMVRAGLREQVGLLDERYFMYGEDMDWAFRIKAVGWRITYVPAVRVIHNKRAASTQHRGKTIGYFYDAMRLFYRDHYQGRYPAWVSALVLGAIGARERLELAGHALSRRRRPQRA